MQLKPKGFLVVFFSLRFISSNCGKIDRSARSSFMENYQLWAWEYYIPRDEFFIHINSCREKKGATSDVNLEDRRHLRLLWMVWEIGGSRNLSNLSLVEAASYQMISQIWRSREGNSELLDAKSFDVGKVVCPNFVRMTVGLTWYRGVVLCVEI